MEKPLCIIEHLGPQRRYIAVSLPQYLRGVLESGSCPTVCMKFNKPNCGRQPSQSSAQQNKVIVNTLERPA